MACVFAMTDLNRHKQMPMVRIYVNPSMANVKLTDQLLNPYQRQRFNSF